jgi:hypothetical protein
MRGSNLKGFIRQLKVVRVLVAKGFSDYVGLTRILNDLLREHGYDVTVSVSAMQRYGQEFQEDFERDMAEANQTYQIAKQAMAGNDDAEGVVRDATIRTLQTRLLRISSLLKKAEVAGDNVHLLADTAAKIAKGVGALSKVDIDSQKYKQQLEEAAFKARLSVLGELKDFIGKSFPQYKSVFAEVLKPFGEFLTHGKSA